MKSIAYSFRLGATTVSNVISRVCGALWDNLNDEFVKIPDEDGWLKISEDFELKWNFPHCLGAIDGKHVCIQVRFFSYTT